MRPSIHELTIQREPRTQYGSLEAVIRNIRDHRPLDLNAEVWRAAHPSHSFWEWKGLAQRFLRDGLHYNPGPLDLKTTIKAREERDGYVIETVEFNTTPWFRVEGYFLLPTGVSYPVPGLVVAHAWGGPMLFGKDRIVPTGRDHPILKKHRETYYSGKYLAEEFVKRGYAVIVIDAFHFGPRIPLGYGGLPEQLDPYTLGEEEFMALHDVAHSRDHLYHAVRQFNWAGTTWMGVFFWDDSRCVDFLLSRKEVDPNRIGCTGLSVGAWRTNFLAALDPRIRASVSVGWMTSGDHQQLYNMGAVGTFALLPGVWNRLDLPDLPIMSAPVASMVVVGTEDPLFDPKGYEEAERQIRLGYEWAGCPERFCSLTPPKDHCYDADIQEAAISWFDEHL